MSVKDHFPWKPLFLSAVFGILLLWMDFNDVSPVSDSVGNLDQILGHQMYPFSEIFLLLGSIAVFILQGKYFIDLGRGGSMGLRSYASALKPLIFFLAYIALLTLVDIDDILKLLNVPSALQSSAQSPGYWLFMEAVYPIASMAVFIAFGKSCYEHGKSQSKNM